jgi:hypothetical protein
MKTVIAGCLTLLLCGSTWAIPVGAQSGAKEETKKAGEATKEAGKATAEAGKHAGKATAKATKNAAHKTKKVVTGDAHATCVDGTRQAGTDEAAAAAACSGHGGVAKR